MTADARVDPLVNVFGALDGEILPGGCNGCNAYEKVHAVSAGVWRITTHHDRSCPIFDPAAPSPPPHPCWGLDGPPEGVTAEPCPPGCLCARLQAAAESGSLEAVLAGEWWALKALGGEGWAIPTRDEGDSR